MASQPFQRRTRANADAGKARPADGDCQKSKKRKDTANRSSIIINHTKHMTKIDRNNTCTIARGERAKNLSTYHLTPDRPDTEATRAHKPSIHRSTFHGRMPDPCACVASDLRSLWLVRTHRCEGLWKGAPGLCVCMPHRGRVGIHYRSGRVASTPFIAQNERASIHFHSQPARYQRTRRGTCQHSFPSQDVLYRRHSFPNRACRHSLPL